MDSVAFRPGAGRAQQPAAEAMGDEPVAKFEVRASHLDGARLCFASVVSIRARTALAFMRACAKRILRCARLRGQQPRAHARHGVRFRPCDAAAVSSRLALALFIHSLPTALRIFSCPCDHLPAVPLPDLCTLTVAHAGGVGKTGAGEADRL